MPLLSPVFDYAQTTVNGSNNQTANTNSGIQIQANINISNQLKEVSRKVFGTEANWETTLIPGGNTIVNGNKCVPPPNALTIQLGEGNKHSTAWCTGKSCGVIESPDTHILEITRTGRVLTLNAEVFGDDGRIIASIENGKVAVNGNNAFRWTRPDPHKIVVIDEHNQTALSVDFTNASTVVISGLFYNKSKGHVDIQSDSFTVFPPGTPQGGVCFGDISDKGWAVWVDSMLNSKTDRQCSSTDVSLDGVCVGFDVGVKLAEEGDAYYKNREFTKAFDLYQSAARQGNANAMFMMGYMYHTSQGTGRDLSKAFRNYSNAASVNEARSSKQLAVWYAKGVSQTINRVAMPIDGLLLQQDCVQAKVFHKKATIMGGPEAKLDYIRFLRGDYTGSQSPCPTDVKEAARITLEEVAKGDEQVSNYLLEDHTYNSLIELGPTSYGLDDLKNILKILADRDDTRAMEWLARIAEGSKDVQGELSWLNKAIGLRDQMAMRRLGKIYLNGDETPADYGKARTLLEQAASRDSPDKLKNAYGRWPNSLYFQTGSSRHPDFTCRHDTACAKECPPVSHYEWEPHSCSEVQVTDIGIRLFRDKWTDLTAEQIVQCEQTPVLLINATKLLAILTDAETGVAVLPFDKESDLQGFQQAVIKACPATRVKQTRHTQ